MRRPDPNRPEERGAALLTVLLLVAVMAVVAATALERVALATRMTGNGGAVDQGRALADAGMVIARLKIGDLVAASPGKTTLAGNWMGTPQAIPVPGGMATARVTDGSNCFNLNSVVAGNNENSLKVRPVAVSQFQALLQALGVDVRQAQVEGVAGLSYIETLDDWNIAKQQGDLHVTGETDRIYLNTPAKLSIVDPAWERRIELTASGSRSAVIWNPWIDRAAAFSDMANDGWQRMLCIETANVMDDIVQLAAGASHTLGVSIASKPL